MNIAANTNDPVDSHELTRIGTYDTFDIVMLS